FYGSGSPHLSFNPVMGLNTATQDAILNFVMGAMFLILPALWITAIGWAGIHASGIVDGLTKGTDGVQKAGSRGGQITEQSVKSLNS
ncbi:TPA: conjugal transfer protein TraG N-terminal domain-containing protein, partial [Pseudomonas aeruginosa]